MRFLYRGGGIGEVFVTLFTELKPVFNELVKLVMFLGIANILKPLFSKVVAIVTVRHLSREDAARASWTCFGIPAPCLWIPGLVNPSTQTRGCLSLSGPCTLPAVCCVQPAQSDTQSCSVGRGPTPSCAGVEGTERTANCVPGALSAPCTISTVRCAACCSSVWYRHAGHCGPQVRVSRFLFDAWYWPHRWLSVACT